MSRRRKKGSYSYNYGFLECSISGVLGVGMLYSMINDLDVELIC